MNTKTALGFVVVTAFVGLATAGPFIVDDGAEYLDGAEYVEKAVPEVVYQPIPVQVKRDRRENPSYHAPKGRVGPVYTFVKTDPQANFKWGVRHRAGSQYGR